MEKTTRILFLGRYPLSSVLSGPETVATKLYIHLRQFYPSSAFLTYYFKDQKQATIWNRFFGSEVIDHEFAVWKKGMVNLILYLITNRPDILHIVTSERFMIPVVVAAKILRIKIIATLHGILKYESTHFTRPKGITPWNRMKDTILERLMLQCAHRIILLSRLHQEMLESYYRLDHSKIAIIPNGVDHEFVQKKRKQRRAKTSIIYFHRKQVDPLGTGKLLAMLSPWIEGNIEIHVITDDENANVDQTHSSVTYHTPMPRELLTDFLLKMDVLINTAPFESFSLLTLEGMACGVVPCVSERAGISEYLDHRKNGFVYSAQERSSLEAVLQDIFTHAVDLDSIAAESRKTAASLNWQSIAEQYQKQYQVLLNH